MAKQGKIKISSKNMMPIIKKWLYSDKDIFLREIVANGVEPGSPALQAFHSEPPGEDLAS